jgi:hypothetical protein
MAWEAVGEALLVRETDNRVRWQQTIRVRSETPSDPGPWIARIGPVVQVGQHEMQTQVALIGRVESPTALVLRTQFLGRMKGGSTILHALQLPDSLLGAAEAIEWRTSDGFLHIEPSPESQDVGSRPGTRPGSDQFSVRVEVPKSPGPFDAWVEGLLGEDGPAVRWRLAGLIDP